MPVYRKTGLRTSAKFFINLHLAGSIYRRRLKIFLEVFALAPFLLPSFLHVKIKRAPAHSKNPLKLQNHDPRNEHIRQLSHLQPQAQILLGRSNHFRRRELHGRNRSPQRRPSSGNRCFNVRRCRLHNGAGLLRILINLSSLKGQAVRRGSLSLFSSSPEASSVV